MVGVVLVSHSAGMAFEAAALIREIAGEDVPVVGVGGTDDGRLGTSLDLIAAAIEGVDGGDGVVLVSDLGISVLIARLLEESVRLVLVDVLLVMGSMAAAVCLLGLG